MSSATFMAMPVLRTYNDNQLQALIRHLDQLELDTAVSPLGSADELTLNSLGLTVSGRSRLAAPAVAAICRHACPGLFKVIASLSGLAPDDKRSPSPADALSTYCRIVTARFDETLSDKSVVRDVKLNQIDGIIGAGYQYLSNRRFYDQVDTAVAQATPSLVFHGASLAGRTLMLKYRQAQTIKIGSDNYHPGLYFVNSELGDHSVRAASIVIQAKTNYQATSPFQEGRIVHSGRDFRSRVGKTLQTSINKYNLSSMSIAKLLAKGLGTLGTISLGFKNLTIGDATNRAEELITRLCRKKISNQHAERIIYTALNWGAAGRPPQGSYEAALRREMWGARTAYDLFVTLIRDAASRPMSYRLGLERVAYDLAIGKTNLVR